MNYIEPFIKNTVLLSALYSWIFAQFLKLIIELLKKNKIKSKDFILRAIFGTGGMPSSHSATIAAVALSIGLKNGFDSSIFAFAMVMVIIVIRDATGVRLATGKQAKAINQIMENQYKIHNIPYEKIREVRGHTPLETFVGIVVGLLVSLGLNWDLIKP